MTGEFTTDVPDVSRRRKQRAFTGVIGWLDEPDLAGNVVHHAQFDGCPLWHEFWNEDAGSDDVTELGRVEAMHHGDGEDGRMPIIVSGTTTLPPGQYAAAAVIGRGAVDDDRLDPERFDTVTSVALGVANPWGDYGIVVD